MITRQDLITLINKSIEQIGYFEDVIENEWGGCLSIDEQEAKGTLCDEYYALKSMRQRLQSNEDIEA